MSNLIPGNQKHMTLVDRIYIEDSLNAGLSFKDIARYLCKDPTTISKEVRLHRLDDVQPKRIFNNPTTFVRNASVVNVPMSVKRLLSVTPIVLPVSNAIRSASTLSKNSVIGLIRLLMSAMDALRQKVDVQFHINIPMMQNLPSVSMKNSELNQEKV